MTYRDTFTIPERSIAVPPPQTQPASSISGPGVTIHSQVTEDVIQILLKAFAQEPHNKWLFREDGRRDKAIAEYLRTYFGAIEHTGTRFIMSDEKDACAVVGASVHADHDLSMSAYARLILPVMKACSPRRVHRMLAMERALGMAHTGLKHLPHLIFFGTTNSRSRSTERIVDYLTLNYQWLVAETADPRVAALMCKRGGLETGRARPFFGGPEMIFVLLPFGARKSRRMMT